YDRQERLGGRLDAAAIAAMDPDELVASFSQRPALHRFPGSMAKRVQDVCRHLVGHYDGRAERLWEGAKSGDELFARLRAVPGFGEQKAQIFLALLAKRLGVTPPGWEQKAGTYGESGYYSVADIDAPGAVEQVRAYKQSVKA